MIPGKWCAERLLQWKIVRFVVISRYYLYSYSYVYWYYHWILARSSRNSYYENE